MARLRRLWLLISLAGAAMSIVGLIGAIAHWGSTTGPARSVAHTTTGRPTTSSVSSAVPPSHSPAGTQPQSETPVAFFARFTEAVRHGDTAFLGSRIDPAVTARYGAAQCAGAVHGLTDPTQHLQLVGTSGPVQYAYVTDGLSTIVPGTFVFHVQGTAAGQSGPRDYHFALSNGVFHLFLDCGTPLHR